MSELRSAHFKLDVSVTEMELLMSLRRHDINCTVQSLIEAMRRRVSIKVHTRDT